MTHNQEENQSIKADAEMIDLKKLYFINSRKLKKTYKHNGEEK